MFFHQKKNNHTEVGELMRLSSKQNTVKPLLD